MSRGMKVGGGGRLKKERTYHFPHLGNAFASKTCLLDYATFIFTIVLISLCYFDSQVFRKRDAEYLLSLGTKGVGAIFSRH